MHIANIRIVSSLAAVVLLLAPAPVQARSSKTVLAAELVPPDVTASAGGTARYTAARRLSRLSIRVRHVDVPGPLTVVVDGETLTATLQLDERQGRGKLDLKLADSIGLVVQDGSTIELFDTGGNVVLAGVFGSPGEHVPELPPPAQAPGCRGIERLRLEARLEAAEGVATPASGHARFESCAQGRRLCVEVEDVNTDPQVTEVAVEVVLGDAVILLPQMVPVSDDDRRGGKICVALAEDDPLAAIVAGGEVHVKANGNLLLVGILEVR